MPQVFIGVGSNEGDRFKEISDALTALAANDAVRLVQVAPIIETEPVGGPAQARFLNTVIEIETRLQPMALLNALKAIEKKQGRDFTAPRWSARPIDLDILLYDSLVLATAELSIPHPRMHERSFVLQPLLQLAPQVIHPVLAKSISQLSEAANR